MVPTTIQIPDSPPSTDPGETGSSTTAPLGALAPVSTSAQPSRLVSIPLSMQGKGYSEEVIQTVLSSKAASTRRVYSAQWNKFAGWCHRSGKDPELGDSGLVATS